MPRNRKHASRTHVARNHVARSPLLRKGGVHITSKTGQRLQARLSLENELDEWRDEIEEQSNNEEKENRESETPCFLADYRQPSILHQH